MIPYTPKQNERPIGQELLISNELHVVGIVGVATIEANMIKLVEVPLQQSPSSVAIPGYAETTSSTPGNGQFYVDYVNGYITFNATANGNSVQVTYYGRGSEIDAVDLNELQEPVGATVSADSSTGSNYALAPTALIFGVLTVTNPASITITEVNDYTGLIIVATSTVNVTIPSPTNTLMGRFFTVLNKSTSTQSISVNGNTLLIGYGATWLWDGVAWALISPVPATSGIPIVATDPVSPFTGQVWFNSTSMQFIGYNGTTKVILG